MSKRRDADRSPGGWQHTPEVVTCDVQHKRLKQSAFQRYAEEREASDHVSTRRRSRSASPPAKRERKNRVVEETQILKTKSNEEPTSTVSSEATARRGSPTRAEQSSSPNAVTCLSSFKEGSRGRRSTSGVWKVSEMSTEQRYSKQDVTDNEKSDRRPREGRVSESRSKGQSKEEGHRRKREESSPERKHHSRHWSERSRLDTDKRDRRDHREHGDYMGERDYRDQQEQCRSEQRPPDMKRFIIEDKRQCIVVTRRPGSFSLLGHASVRCLFGDAIVYGFHLREGAAPVDIYSPTSTSLVTVETVTPLETCSKESLEKRLEELLAGEPLQKKDVLSAVEPESTVLLFTELPSRRTVEFVSSLNQFQHIFTPRRSTERDAAFLSLGSVPMVVSMDPALRPVHFSQEMKKIAEKFSSLIQAGKTPIIVACGGKNVGKSTLCRYLTNTALNKCRQVAYLECDVGQTEYSPPGCVSLHVLSTPVIGPPFTHQRPAHRMTFYGAVTPANDPAFYLECVQRAVQAYSRLNSPCPPLIVNTMGWTEGLGLMFLASTLKMIRPDLVVQMMSDAKTRNMAPVTPEFVDEQEELPAPQGGQTTTYTPLLTHDLLTVHSPVRNSSKWRVDRFNAIDHRRLSLLGYMSRYQEEGAAPLPLHQVAPQTLPWGHVAVHVIHVAVPNMHVMYALNASVVALCRVEEELILSPDDDSLPRFLSEKPTCECLGFGVIRAIDPEKKVFHIISDIPLGNDSDVNCLIRGSLDIPLPFITEQPSIDDEIPYFGESKDVAGAMAIRRRRHLVRGAKDEQRKSDQHKQ